MNIYFAASIRGGRNDVSLYSEIINFLKKYGHVFTEHIADANLSKMGEMDMTDKEIHDRDMTWLLSADVVIAEVTTPSLGVGYEIGRAIEHDIPVICFFREEAGRRLSAMISGNDKITTYYYRQPKELMEQVQTILERF